MLGAVSIAMRAASTHHLKTPENAGKTRPNRRDCRQPLAIGLH